MNRDPRTRAHARTELDRRLEEVRPAMSALSPPRGGWVAAIRRALGMTQAHLAERLGVSRQAVSQLEAREVEGSATLKAMEDAAQALGGRLVYAIVPDGALDATVRGRALRLAEGRTEPLRRAMRAEGRVGGPDLDALTRELADDLMDRPSRLWSGSEED